MKGAGSGLVEGRTYCDLCRASNEPCPPTSTKFATVILDLIQSEPMTTRLPIKVKDNKERSKRAHSLDNENALSSKNRQQKPHICSQPVPDPFWRGSMKIGNRKKKLDIGLVAHLSTLASSKLCDATNSLPKSLQMEILPRLGVWPKRFGTRALEDGDIGIYFFPENESCEKDFDELLDDMIFEDAAVKASFDFADLLIFTSLVLPLQHQNNRNKHYLWGLFSREKFSSKSIRKVLPGST